MKTTYKQKINKAVLILCMLSVAASFALLTGCSSTADNSNTESNNDDITAEESQSVADAAWEAFQNQLANYDMTASSRDEEVTYDESEATYIELTDASATVNGTNTDKVDVSDNNITINNEGTYVLSGTLNDGTVFVSADDTAKVQLVLNNANISSSTHSAIAIYSADKAFITLVDGSVNTISDGTSYASTDDATETDADEANAAIWSDCDLTVNGSGTLNISGNSNDAINTKDDLVIAAGATLNIEAIDDGLVGHDSLLVVNEDTTLNITAGGDGLKVSKDDDETKGWLRIDNGIINIDAADDGLDGSCYVGISNGTVNITSQDDGIHTDGSAEILNGTITINAGDDAAHSEAVMSVSGGTVKVESCVEGLEGQNIFVSDGDIDITSSDDGMNAAGGDTSTADSSSGGNSNNSESASDTTQNSNPSSDATNQNSEQGIRKDNARSIPQDGNMNLEEMPQDFNAENFNAENMPTAPDDNDFNNGEMPHGVGGGDMMVDGGTSDPFSVDADCTIVITGGNLKISAGGDGIDSNGSFAMSGGTAAVSSNPRAADTALDYASTAVISGGDLLLVGGDTMFESLNESQQAFITQETTIEAGSTVSLLDSDGNVITSIEAVADATIVQASVNGAAEGDTITFVVNDDSIKATASTTPSEEYQNLFGGGFSGDGAPNDDVRNSFGGDNAGNGIDGGTPPSDNEAGSTNQSS